MQCGHWLTAPRSFTQLFLWLTVIWTIATPLALYRGTQGSKDVTVWFSTALLHLASLCGTTKLEQQWEQPGDVLCVSQGCRHPMSCVAGEALCREGSKALTWCASSSLNLSHLFKAFSLAQISFLWSSLLCNLSSPCCSLNHSSPICSGHPDQLLPPQLRPFLQIITTSYKYGCEAAKCQFSLERWFI